MGNILLQKESENQNKYSKEFSDNSKRKMEICSDRRLEKMSALGDKYSPK